MARRQIPVGKRKITWKPTKESPWFDGGTVTITEGGKTTVRISKTGGARLE